MKTWRSISGMARARYQAKSTEYGKRDSIQHHLREAISETTNALELKLKHKFLYTTPVGGSGGVSMCCSDKLLDSGIPNSADF